MKDYATRTLDRLRQNDPSKTDVEIFVRHFIDAELSAALRTNEHVNNIQLNFENLENNTTNWDSLLRVIATREILEKVTLFADSGEDDTEQVAPFLLAIQRNSSVQTMELYELRLSGGLMASFIDCAKSLTTLSITRCHMVDPGGALAVSDALKRNTNIQRLELNDLRGMYLIPIVNGLTSNTTVKILKLWFGSVLLDESLAVGSLLESTRTIERLELALGDFYDVEVDTFCPIAQGLIQSTSITDVSFANCNFDGQEVVLLLNSILESKTNLQSLTLDSCNLHEDGRECIRSAILSLLRPNSLLRSLEVISDYLSHCGFGASQDFARLLTAVESSPLERFAFGPIHSSKYCLALIASIPRMQVRTLELRLGDDLEDMTRDFIQAVKQNASLRTVAVKYDNADWDWLDDADNLKLLAYLARNEFLPQWMENPAVVPDAAWSEYLAAVAQTTGPDTIFCILVSLTPSLWNAEGE
jgi:hypothetical protein